MIKKQQAQPAGATPTLPAAVEAGCHPVLVQLQSELRLKQSLVLGITSLQRGEGRTTIALGFAAAAAKQFGNTPGRVLLVDGDLENPSLHRFAGVAGEPGLTEVFTRQMPLEQVVVPVLPGVALLPVGKVLYNLTRQYKELEALDFFAALGKFYDTVIIDLPPVQAYSIGTLPERLVPQFCLVARAGRARRDAVQRALMALPQERMAEVILNEERRFVPRWIDRLLS